MKRKRKNLATVAHNNAAVFVLHFYDIKDEATSDQFAIVQVKQTPFL